MTMVGRGRRDTGATDGDRPGRSVIALVPGSERDASVRARVLHWQRRGEPIVPIEVGRGLAGHRRLLHELRPRRGRASLAEGHTHLVLRNASPFGWGRPESAFLRRGRLAVYELDDGLPFDDGRLPDHGRAYKRLFPKQRIARQCADASDRIIVGNDILADWAMNVHHDVVVIPTCVEPTDYATKDSYEVGRTPRLGWIGSAATEVHLWTIADALAEVHQRTGARLEIITAPGNRVPAQMQPFVDLVEWGPGVNKRLAHWDIGLMPLPDRPYERAKCAYKLLEYAASSLPMVGSPIGASGDVLRSVGAPSPQRSEDWVDALTSLLGADPTARARIGRQGRAVALERYSYDAWQDRWRAAMGLENSAVRLPNARGNGDPPTQSPS